MAKPTPDRLTPDQAEAVLQAVNWATEHNPKLGKRLLDVFDPLCEGRDKLKATRRRAEPAAAE
jgi:hypothetical protein